MTSSTHEIITMEQGDDEEEIIQSSNHNAPPSSYIRSPDFMELCCCIVFGVVCAVVQMANVSMLRYRPIPVQLIETGEAVYDLSLSQELKNDTVSNLALIFIAVVIPVLLQFVCSIRFGNPGDSHATVCVYIVGVSLTRLVTFLTKSYAGYLRPVFYELCVPDANYEECTSQNERDARMSFPSGHSSVSFCGLSLLTLFLLDHFGVSSCPMILCEGMNGTILARYRKPPRIQRLFSILCLAPMAVATFVAISRVADDKHFPADVVGGSIIGAALGWFAHRLWFPAWPLA